MDSSIRINLGSMRSLDCSATAPLPCPLSTVHSWSVSVFPFLLHCSSADCMDSVPAVARQSRGAGTGEIGAGGRGVGGGGERGSGERGGVWGIDGRVLYWSAADFIFLCSCKQSHSLSNGLNATDKNLFAQVNWGEANIDFCWLCGSSQS